MRKFQDLLFFNDFVQKYTTEFEQGYRFIIYTIGSPIPSLKSSPIKNQYQTPLYILVRKPSTPKALYSLIVHYVPFEYIIRIAIGDEILPGGNISSLNLVKEFGSDKNKNKGFLTHEVFSISKYLVQNPIKLTLADIIVDYGLFNKVPKDLLDSNVSQELFYLFQTEKQENLIISACEILRHFYLASPGRSLLKNILNPTGIHYLARHLIVQRTRYNQKKVPYFLLDIHPSSQIIDAQKIFFFSFSRKNRHYFSSVAHNFFNTHRIDASIPSSRTVSLYADAYKQGDNIIITKIHESSIFEYMKHWKVDYTHPLSKLHQVHTEKKPYQPLQQADTTQIVSHEQYINAKVKSKKISDKSQFYGEGKMEKPIFPTGPTFQHMLDDTPIDITQSDGIPQHLGSRDLGLSNNKIHKDGPVGMDLVTKKAITSKKEAKEEIDKDQHAQELYDKQDGEKVIQKIIQEFKNQGCLVHKVENKNVERPYVARNVYTVAKKYYVEIFIEKAELNFIYIDILSKQHRATAPIYKDTKEVLLIKNDEHFKYSHIEDFVHDQLEKGNHKWGTKSPYKTTFTYATIRHRHNLKSFIKTILEIMSHL